LNTAKARIQWQPGTKRSEVTGSYAQYPVASLRFAHGCHSQRKNNGGYFFLVFCVTN